MKVLSRFHIMALCAAFIVSPLFTAFASAASQPNVVVTLKPIHALVSQLMDGVGVPALIVSGSASPHTFTLKPSAARAIQDAEVFIRVSDRVEPFTRKIVEALPKNVVVITLVEQPGMTLLEQRTGGTFEAHEHHHRVGDPDEGDGGHQDEHPTALASTDGHLKDGHIWLDPENAKAIVLTVSRELAKRYPESADRLQSNAAALTSQLDGLETELSQQLQTVKSKPFVVFHDATQYFENRFGLTAVGSITVSPDVQPSAKRLTDVRRKISGLNAICVFAEPDFQPNLIAAVTDGTTAKSGTLDAEAQTLTPAAGLYFAMMRKLATSIVTCLNQ